MSITDSLGKNASTREPTLDLHEIQATVLRQRPAPYFGTHVLLRVDDAQAGREFLRRLDTSYCDSAANWWNAANTWLSVGISYAGLEALGLPQESLQSFPEAFRVGMAARARQLGDEGVNDPKNWDPPFGKGQIHIGRERLQRFRGKAAARPRHRPRAVRGLLRRQRFGHAGLRRAAGRPQFAGLQGRHRPAGDRGQRCRAATGPGTADQGRRVHPRISG